LAGKNKNIKQTVKTKKIDLKGPSETNIYKGAGTILWIHKKQRENGRRGRKKKNQKEGTRVGKAAKLDPEKKVVRS